MKETFSISRNSKSGESSIGEGFASTDPATSSTVQWNPEDSPKLGRYCLQALIGRGGFGEVWRGFDPELRRSVAIKVFRTDKTFSKENIDLMLQEGQRLAQLTHPSVVTVFDVGYHDSQFFMVTALIEGGSLADLIKRQKLRHDETASIVAEIAKAVHSAHLAGIIHRDIKPENILIDYQNRPFLADFGISTTEDDQLKEIPGVVGTCAYMSPEQIRGDSNRLDSRSDVYSLGVVLYQLLTGRLPFKGKNLQQFQDQILGKQPRPPRTIDDQIPAELESICLKCLSKEVEERFTTALDLADVLTKWQDESSARRNKSVWLLLAGFCGAATLLWIGKGMNRPELEAPQPVPQIADAVNGDRHDSNWEELLLEPPIPFIACEQGTARLVGASDHIIIDSSRQSSAWILGEPATRYYKLHVSFDFLPPGEQDSNSPRLGLILGADAKGEGNLRWQGQVVTVHPSRNGSFSTLKRSISTISMNARHTLDMGVVPLATQSIDLNEDGSQTISLTVGPKGLQEFSWNGTPIPMFVSDSTNAFVKRSLYNGKIGIFVEDARIELIQFRISGEEIKK